MGKWSWMVAVVFVIGVVVKCAGAQDVGAAVEQTAEKAQQELAEIAEEVDASEEAQRASAGVLKPIYELAERLAFSGSYAIAFGLTVTGVVSFALQLVLGKLVVLTRRGFSITEILSDLLGLVVSLVGLIFTTQAAAENSSFTASAFAVLSSTAIGAVAGIFFYLWGQRQELDAVAGRNKQTSPS